MCPSYIAGVIAPVDCYSTTCPSSATFATISEDGATYTTGTALSTYVLYNSYSFIDRICIPETEVFAGALSTALSSFSSSVDTGTFSDFITDLQNNWQWMILFFFFSVILSFIWMYALKCLAGCIVWGSIFGIIGILSGIGLIFLYNAGELGSIDAYTKGVGIPTVATS